ncbi:MAG: imidazole glycerol phosphate synthase subunit HisH [Victivallales bacterium]
MIIIVDYGMGNIRSIQHKLQKNGIDANVSSSPSDILSADKLILPGVGHFKKGMENLKKFNLVEVLNRKVLEEKAPVMGICLGIQLFTNFSEEGNVSGLGWIKAETKRLIFNNPLVKIPHIGWERLELKNKCPYLYDMSPEQRFYFVHSYHVIPESNGIVAATACYGDIEFVASIFQENIFGVQFHPEKSHKSGMNVLLKFCRS